METIAGRILVTGAHAAGEVGRVITGGVAPPPGDSLFEQARWLEHNNDGLRKLLLFEPRGGAFCHANLLVPPKSPEADAAFIIMEPDDYPPMSGSNTMCVATVLLETGLVAMREPETSLVLETPGGLVKVTARCCDGQVTEVKLDNVPCYAALLDGEINLPGHGPLKADVGYGGAFFVIVDARTFGFELVASEARRLVETGEAIKAAAVEQLKVCHPDNPAINKIAFTQFTLPVTTEDGQATGRNSVVISPGKLDRSPCGTGTSARLAVMHARGQMATGDGFISRSVINSRFDGRIERKTLLSDGTPAIVPSIAGRAFITGYHQYVLSPSDPWPEGYTLSDTWYRAL